MTGPDVSVRVAWPADAAAIAELQLSSWYAEELTARLEATGLGRDDLVEAVRESLARPPQARQRTLVALAGEQVVGVASTGPSADPDADPSHDGAIEEYLVAADATGSGHGSRLLQACVDTLRADRFARATYWVRSGDDALRTFLTGAGWATDGASRELADEHGHTLKQIRLHTGLA